MISTYTPELGSTIVKIQATELIDELAGPTGNGIVVMTVGDWPLMLRPDEARQLALVLTLTAEEAEA